MQKNHNLEFVRGFACLLVIINHLQRTHPALEAMNIQALTHWGTEAVMLFFILSGVVINASQTNNKKSRISFLLNRIVRLYPQFLVGLLTATGAFYLLDLQFPGWKNIGLNALMLGTLQGFLVSIPETNQPLWSLTFEMVFYLSFALTIGKHSKRAIFGWFLLSLMAIPVYYSGLENALAMHFITIFAFSSIWLVGYYIYEYQHFFWADRNTALLSLGLLPLVSRLHLTTDYYDPIKFLLFALVAVPFFRFCLGQKQVGQKIHLAYLIGLYAVLLPCLYLFSKSRFESKLLYALAPIVLVLLDLILQKLRLATIISQALKKTGIILGKYSYSIYIIHHPLFLLLAAQFQHWFLFVITACAITALASWLLEDVFQRWVNNLYRKWYPATKQPVNELS